MVNYEGDANNDDDNPVIKGIFLERNNGEIKKLGLIGILGTT
jgi:hypothetical protein